MSLPGLLRRGIRIPIRTRTRTRIRARIKARVRISSITQRLRRTTHINLSLTIPRISSRSTPRSARTHRRQVLLEQDQHLVSQVFDAARVLLPLLRSSSLVLSLVPQEDSAERPWRCSSLRVLRAPSLVRCKMRALVVGPRGGDSSSREELQEARRARGGTRSPSMEPPRLIRRLVLRRRHRRTYRRARVGRGRMGVVLGSLVRWRRRGRIGLSYRCLSISPVRLSYLISDVLHSTSSSNSSISSRVRINSTREVPVMVTTTTTIHRR